MKLKVALHFIEQIFVSVYEINLEILDWHGALQNIYYKMS